MDDCVPATVLYVRSIWLVASRVVVGLLLLEEQQMTRMYWDVPCKTGESVQGLSLC